MFIAALFTVATQVSIRGQVHNEEADRIDNGILPTHQKG